MPDGTEFPSWERPVQFSKTYYVDGDSPRADDTGPGTRERPFRTIRKAADVLQPAERVVIAQGIYREVVQPPRGGTGPDRMISYEAADGANVIIRGSAILKDGWRPSATFPGRGGGAQPQSQAVTWDVDLDGARFAGYNPFGMMNLPQQRWQYMNRMSINVHNILVPYTRVRGMMANSICLSVGGGAAGGGGTTSHIVRGNTMRYCGISGLTGMGTSNLLVEDNLIEWIGWQDAEHMSESAGVKFHNARNLLLRNNVIRHMRHASGIWLDVGNVNCRLTRNVFTDVLTAHAAIWIEASHEQNQVDDNVIAGIREADKLTPPDVETGGGSGSYVLGTDKLIIANNLIANAKRAGVHFRTEEVRIIDGRGGSARDNKVYNNIFFNTGEAAINFENEHNGADGNLYAGLPGGFLRILTPGRPELLNIPAAREYHGWEKNGRMGSIQLSLDPDTLQLTLATSSDIPKVATFHAVSITSDFFGFRTGDARIPGAFADLSQPLKAKSIDPRRMN